MISTRSTGGLARVRISKEDVKDARAMLRGVQNGFVRAYSRALNKTTTGVRTDLVTLAREEYTFKAKAVRSRIRVKRSSWSNLESSVTSTGGGVLLTDFTGTRQTKKGLSVNIKKSTGRDVLEHAFKNRANSGKYVSMWRAIEDGRRVGRYPVEAIYGPHPEHVYNAPENWPRIEARADERLSENFTHEIDYVLTRYA